MSKKDEKAGQPRVACFCMEYAFEPEMQTYAGGLGILAGDIIKGAADAGFPMVGIGILWKQGYTNQRIDGKGLPYDAYSNNPRIYLEDTGIVVDVNIRRRTVYCRIWGWTQYEKAPLYLLDTDLDENDDSDRWITAQLYGWFGEERIAQEMVLGIGGVRALRKLGVSIEVYHFNEGHAVFAGLELIREKMADGKGFEQAMEMSRRQIVFTTHTPVIQRNESHSLDRLMYMGANNGLTLEQLVAIGDAPFNMTVAALRLARISNAVSQLHAKTANRMWQNIDRRSEIIGITNGIHLPTWVDTEILNASGETLWNRHQRNKEELLSFIKERTGATPAAGRLLFGFSRRVVGYKRNMLIFLKESVIRPLLQSRRIQLVFSGKTHPLDNEAKAIVAKMVEKARNYDNSVVFLENYDMTIGKWLTRGVDVWLNNPRRPKEACGTSGMKAAMNGVLNLSIPDGWWPEACHHGVNGWQFGEDIESEIENRADENDAKALYRVLKEEVIPTYYEDRGKWIRMMRTSIDTTQKRFGIERMLEEYYEKMYGMESAS